MLVEASGGFCGLPEDRIIITIIIIIIIYIYMYICMYVYIYIYAQFSKLGFVFRPP